jgi:predicted signal transduction protein with EAL and GGDEF domain
MDSPVELDGRILNVGASIGIALFPEDGHSAAELIRKADSAMYKAKGLGGNQAQFASPNISNMAPQTQEDPYREEMVSRLPYAGNGFDDPSN